MSPVNLNDLPKAVRERIAGQEGAVAKARAHKASTERGPAYRCATPGCGAEWSRYSDTWQDRHQAENPTHVRYEAIL